MIKGKSQVSLAAAEIDDFQGLVSGQVVQDVCGNFQKTIDLTEFSVMLFQNLPLLVHNAKAYQEGTGDAVGDQVMLRFVVRQAGHFFCGGFFLNTGTVRMGSQDLIIRLCGKEIGLLEIKAHHFFKKAAKLIRIQVLMESLFFIRIFRLVHHAFPKGNRPYGDFVQGLAFFSLAAEDKADQAPFIQAAAQKIGHAIHFAECLLFFRQSVLPAPSKGSPGSHR